MVGDTYNGARYYLSMAKTPRKTNMENETIEPMTRQRWQAWLDLANLGKESWIQPGLNGNASALESLDDCSNKYIEHNLDWTPGKPSKVLTWRMDFEKPNYFFEKSGRLLLPFMGECSLTGKSLREGAKLRYHTYTVFSDRFPTSCVFDHWDSEHSDPDYALRHWFGNDQHEEGLSLLTTSPYGFKDALKKHIVQYSELRKGVLDRRVDATDEEQKNVVGCFRPYE